MTLDKRMSQVQALKAAQIKSRIQNDNLGNRVNAYRKTRGKSSEKPYKSPTGDKENQGREFQEIRPKK